MDLLIGFHIILDIAFSFLIIFTFTRFYKKLDDFAKNHATEILTTLGIAGCFIGLILTFCPFVLSAFSHQNSNLLDNIPNLISGVTLSFIPSFLGVLFALLFKWKYKYEINRINRVIGHIKDNSMEISDIVFALKDLKTALAGDQSGSLIAQIVHMRTEQRDGLNALTSELRNFYQKMADNNSKALIEALNDVIKDFNSKLTEQFGENFKQLNQSVEKLVVWQVQYKEELDMIKSYQQQASNDMETASQSFSNLIVEAENFTKVANDLSGLINHLNADVEKVTESEKALHQILSSMKDVTPEFSRKIDQLITNLQRNLEASFSEIEAHQKSLINSTQTTNADMKELLIEVMKKTQVDLSTNMKESSEKMSQQVEILHNGLQTELNDVLKNFGTMLATLSNQFVKDYTPITEGLGKMIRDLHSGSTLKN